MSIAWSSPCKSDESLAAPFFSHKRKQNSAHLTAILIAVVIWLQPCVFRKTVPKPMELYIRVNFRMYMSTEQSLCREMLEQVLHGDNSAILKDRKITLHLILDLPVTLMKCLCCQLQNLPCCPGWAEEAELPFFSSRWNPPPQTR